MRVRHVILRPIVGLAVAAVVMFGVSATAVASTDYTTTIAAPTMFSTVTGDVVVTVTSTAPMVMFILPGEVLGQGTRVPVVSGSASFVWPSDGFILENYINVSNCDEEGLCNLAPAAWVAVEVQNDRPALTAPTDGATVG